MVKDDAWFRAIEDHFVRLRGAPLLLSPGDWHQAAEWQRQGMPLDLVLQAISDVFAAAAARGRRTPIQSLKYCRHAVEAAFAQREAALIGRAVMAPTVVADAAGRVRQLAARIASLSLPTSAPSALEARLLEVSDAIAGVAAGLESGTLVRAGAEAALSTLDQRLLDLLLSALPAGETDDMRARCDRRLAEFGGRLSDAEAAQTRGRMLATELRRRWRVPRLTVLLPAGSVDGD